MLVVVVVVVLAEREGRTGRDESPNSAPLRACGRGRRSIILPERLAPRPRKAPLPSALPHTPRGIVPPTPPERHEQPSAPGSATPRDSAQLFRAGARDVPAVFTERQSLALLPHSYICSPPRPSAPSPKPTSSRPKPRGPIPLTRRPYPAPPQPRPD
jgi:hypothetical protein